jgi:hypothetical protein
LIISTEVAQQNTPTNKSTIEAMGSELRFNRLIQMLAAAPEPGERPMIQIHQTTLDGFH